MRGLSDSVWDRKTIIKLIELFRQQTALWDATCKRRNKKHDAWTSIALEMKMDKAEVEKKMRCLIGQFQRALKKSGPGASEGPGHVKWFAFESLLFLKDKDMPREFRSAGGMERTSQEDTKNTQVASSIKNVAVGDAVHKPRIYWCDMMKGVDNTASEESTSNLDVASDIEVPVPPENNSQDVVEIPTENPAAIEIASTSVNKEDISQRRSTKRKLPLNSADSILHNAIRTMTEMSQIINQNQPKAPKQQQSNDSVDTFGKFIADELRGIRDAGGEAFMRQVQRKIQQVILQSWDNIDNSRSTPSPNLNCFLQSWTPTSQEEMKQEIPLQQ